MDPLEEIRQTFFIECEELLEAMEAGLLAMEEGDVDKETVNAVFRAVHSIKGGAGAFGLEALVRFAHTFETTLDEVRSGRLDSDENVMRILLKSGDALADLVRASRDDSETEGDDHSDLLIELTGLIGVNADDEGADTDEPDDFVPMTIDIGLDDEEDDDVDGSSPPTFAVYFRPAKRLYANGNDAALIIRALDALGDLSVTVEHDDLPSLDALDPEGAYLAWRIRLTTEVGEEAIREAFEFVDGDCDLQIDREAVAETLAPTEKASGNDVPRDDGPSSDFEDGASDDAEPVVHATATSASAPKAPAPKPPAAPVSARERIQKDAGGQKATVRVDLDRVDRLINLVGELVINQAMLSECVTDAGLTTETSVSTGLEEFKQLTREIQESVMAIRAQPVKSLFQRMSRIVREASEATGKSVHLNVEGEATEVDKTVVERLADPLRHMIRNAVDHGLETPEKRLASGKSERGTVNLVAAHRSGRVVIEVSDDGAGINRERVRQIAIEKGLISADAELTNGEIDNLLFLPGFSTAKAVSDLSGRGVGMDVVKRSIQSLGGRIAISSVPGQGTTFSISLPLTLAVLDGMVVNVAGQTLVAPLTSIVETLTPHKADIHMICDDAATMLIRGVFVPVIDVGAQLGYRQPLEDLTKCVILLVETDDGVRSALAVDSIQDQRQVVIKGLESNYGQVPGIAAATILGDGRIALILDADALVAFSSGSYTQIDQDIQLAG